MPRFLIYDDCPQDAQELAGMLQALSEDAVTVCAESEAELRRLIAEDACRALFLDIELGEDSGIRLAQELFPHLVLILAQFPVLLLYRETALRRILLFIGNIVLQTVTEIAALALFAAVSESEGFTAFSADYNGTQLAAGRILIIDMFMLVGILVICLIRRSLPLLRDFSVILLCVGGHFLFLCLCLNQLQDI